MRTRRCPSQFSRAWNTGKRYWKAIRLETSNSYFLIWMPVQIPGRWWRKRRRSSNCGEEHAAAQDLRAPGDFPAQRAPKKLESRSAADLNFAPAEPVDLFLALPHQVGHEGVGGVDQALPIVRRCRIRENLRHAGKIPGREKRCGAPGPLLFRIAAYFHESLFPCPLVVS